MVPPLKPASPVAPQICLVVEVKEKGDEAEGVQEDGHIEPVREGALSKDVVGGVGHNGHKLTQGRGSARGKRRRRRKVRSSAKEKEGCSPRPSCSPLCLPAGAGLPQLRKKKSYEAPSPSFPTCGAKYLPDPSLSLVSHWPPPSRATLTLMTTSIHPQPREGQLRLSPAPGDGAPQTTGPPGPGGWISGHRLAGH